MPWLRTLLNLPLLPEAQTGKWPEATHRNSHIAPWLSLVALPATTASVRFCSVPLCVQVWATLSALPHAQPSAVDVFIDQSKTIWGEGPSAFGLADSWLDQNIRTNLQHTSTLSILRCPLCIRILELTPLTSVTSNQRNIGLSGLQTAS